MTTTKEGENKKPLRLKSPGKLELSKTVETGQVRQSFSHGRSKAVAVEVKRKRTFQPGESGGMSEVRGAREEAERAFKPRPAETSEAPKPAAAETPKPAAAPVPPARAAAPQSPRRPRPQSGQSGSGGQVNLTSSERQARLKALELARREEDKRRAQAEREADEARRRAEEAARMRAEEEARRQEEEARRQAEQQRREAEEEARRREEEARQAQAPAAAPAGKAAEPEVLTPEEVEARKTREKARPAARSLDDELQDELGGRVKRRGAGGAVKPAPSPKRVGEGDRRRGKLTISKVLEDDGDGGSRGRSLAAMRRQRERQRQKQRSEAPIKVLREVVIPEVITVGELANRMAERGAAVIKALMKMDIMATINQTIDADTAELVVEEFGHKVKRVSDADVEIGMRGEADDPATLRPRAPVVTVMGHVDHGKTSLLDALRRTDVAAGEAGGITQHIGAYQVQLRGGDKITFIDTPGHAAFTEMRSRGATVTDIVILVVAADDGIMEQTVEALNHAKAAKVPMIIAINKMDKPEANPDRVRQELLNHEIVVEAMGGDVLDVEVSAKSGQGLDKLEEAILLQAEILELKANAGRAAEGVVIEAKLEKGRGPVATVLIQRGTLSQGDAFVAGAEWGRVRALINDRGEQIKSAGPSQPVEILGLQGAPVPGDELVAVENESRAREIAEFRQEQRRQKDIAASGRGSLEQMLSRIKQGEVKELPVVVKSDVQGSLEAIVGAFEKLGNEEVKVRVLHAGVGGINESDVTLARASEAVIIGFNVRANPQARDMARRDSVDIRYYSIIYNVVDDVKAALQGMLSPEEREKIIGYADIRQVFSITKVGKVAGCRVTEGVVRRGAKVRLLRDDVVVHEGTLKSLKRFKDEVREVKDGYECGMAFENYDDIKEGDRIECFEIEEIAREI